MLYVWSRQSKRFDLTKFSIDWLSWNELPIANIKEILNFKLFYSLHLFCINMKCIFWTYLKLRNAPFTLWVRPLSLSFAQDLTWTLLNTEFIVPKVFAITSLSAHQSSRYVKQHFNSTIDLIWSAIFCIIIWKLISM